MSIVVNEIPRIQFFCKILAKSLFFFIPMSATLASLRKIIYSRWRPKWLPNTDFAISWLLIVLEMRFLVQNITFWSQGFHLCTYEYSKSNMAVIYFNMAANFCSSNVFLCERLKLSCNISMTNN